MCKETIKLIVISAILLITTIIIWRVIYVNTKREKGFGEYSTKLVGITFIVAMALIAYVYDSNNSSMIFALLGTLAGYFLGYRKENKEKDEE